MRHANHGRLRLRGTSRPGASSRPAPTPRPTPPARKARGHSHKQDANPDGPSDIERGDLAAMGERAARAMRAALDDAIRDVAARFNLDYEVLRGIADGTGCDYGIRLVVKPRPRALAR